MAALKKDRNINLLHEEGFSSTTSGRVLLWVLSTFRFIVIVTEIIVMLAFLSRFWLDAQNSDLAEEIETKKRALEASSDFERDFRNVQLRLAAFDTLTTEATINSGLVTKLSQFLPADTIVERITFDNEEKSLELEGISPSELSIHQFLVNLNSLEEFETVTLMDMQTDLESVNSIAYRISISLRGI